MLDHERLQCAEGVEALGAFANAFRVAEVDPEGCLLDFLLYSEREKRAQVVARVRVRQEFLPSIRDRLDEVVVASGKPA